MWANLPYSRRRRFYPGLPARFDGGRGHGGGGVAAAGRAADDRREEAQRDDADTVPVAQAAGGAAAGGSGKGARESQGSPLLPAAAPLLGFGELLGFKRRIALGGFGSGGRYFIDWGGCKKGRWSDLSVGGSSRARAIILSPPF